MALRPGLSTRRQLARRGTFRGNRWGRLEALEERRVLTGFCDLGTCVDIEMLPEFDTFGNQIETFQAYGDGEDALVAYSIYDTGASVITWSANDQLVFQLLDGQGIPVKVPGGAGADAIGGGLNGDVSEPGVIRAVGLHGIDSITGFEFGINFDDAGRAEGVQSFIGTTSGSSQLPTITGVPIHYPSPAHTDGVAARIDMNAYEYDLGALFPEFGELFEGLILYAPDIFFVDSGQVLEDSPDGDTTAPIRIPLELFGEDNHANPGDEITYVENPVQPNVFLADNGVEITDQTLLFDTGAQLTVVSTEIALSLGLNLDVPTMTIDVQGAAGSTQIPGYFIDELQVPIDSDGDGTFEGGLQFTNVPIFVLDLVPGLDGILGMNLFNTADVMLYDPFDPLGPSLQTRFFNDLVRETITLDETDGLDPSEIDLISAAFPTLAGNLPSGTRTLANLGLGNPVSDTSVLDRYLFYNDSVFDGNNAAANAADNNAIAHNISPLFSGDQANSSQVSSNVDGITGLMIDVKGLADPAALSATDFEFRVGNSNDTSGWAAAPAPQSISVAPGAGVSNSDRISVTWAAGEVANTWLEVRLRASAATGLEFDDVFYFGNRAGDTNGDGRVNATDFSHVRANPRNFLNPATANDPFDLNHDGLSNAADLLLVRDNITTLSTQLNMITPPVADVGNGMVATLNVLGSPSTPARSANEALSAQDTFNRLLNLSSLTLPSDSLSSADDVAPVDRQAATVERPPATDIDSIDRLMAAIAESTTDSDEVEVQRNSFDFDPLEVELCFPE